MVVCGCPFGSDIFISDFLMKKHEEIAEGLAMVLEYRGPLDEKALCQESFTLFRSCIMTKLGYLMRVLPMGFDVGDFFQDSWDMWKDFIVDLFGWSYINSETEKLLSLPIMEGGGGIVPVHLVHGFAYLASLIECSFRYGGRDDDGLRELLLHCKGMERGMYVKFFAVGNRNEVKGLQKKWTSYWMKKRVAIFLNEAPKIVAARVVGSSGNGSKWMFSKGNKFMNQKEYLTNLSLRFDQPLPFGLQSSFDDFFACNFKHPSQLLGISKGGGVIARHNYFEKILSKVLKKAGWDVRLEPMIRHRDSGDKRADLVLNRVDLYQPIYIDLAFLNSTCDSYLEKFKVHLKDNLFKAIRLRKMRKYQKEVREIGGYFVPFVVDVFGRFDPKIMKVLKNWFAGSENLKKIWMDFSIMLAKQRSWTLERLLDNFKVGEENKIIFREREGESNK